MTSARQFEANRRNSQKSTGPKTDRGKRHSRRNAFRHGLCAETVIEILEDVECQSASNSIPGTAAKIGVKAGDRVAHPIFDK